jgi:hypothetical protein
MKRSMFAVLGIAAAVLSVPALALATHQTSRSHRLSRHHHVGRHAPAAYTGSGGATVTSYANGVLTLALQGGGSLTGRVTEGTHFICLSDSSQWHGKEATVRAKGVRHGGDRGATGGSGPSGPTGGTGPSGPRGWGGGSGGGSGSGGGTGTHGGRPSDRHGSSGSWGGNQTPPPPCDSSLLTGNASIQSAAVLIAPGGVDFTTIVLPAV